MFRDVKPFVCITVVSKTKLNLELFTTVLQLLHSYITGQPHRSHSLKPDVGATALDLYNNNATETYSTRLEGLKGLVNLVQNELVDH